MLARQLIKDDSIMLEEEEKAAAHGDPSQDQEESRQYRHGLAINHDSGVLSHEDMF